MTLETECNECDNAIESGDEIYCKGCIDELYNDIENLESEIIEKDEEIVELQEKIDELEERIKEIEGENNG